jgi:hypothetical protein
LLGNLSIRVTSLKITQTPEADPFLPIITEEYCLFYFPTSIGGVMTLVRSSSIMAGLDVWC